MSRAFVICEAVVKLEDKLTELGFSGKFEMIFSQSDYNLLNSIFQEQTQYQVNDPKENRNLQSIFGHPVKVQS